MLRKEGIRRDTKGYEGIRRDTKGYEGIRRDTKGYEGIRRDTKGYEGIRRDTKGYEGIRRDANGYWYLFFEGKTEVCEAFSVPYFSLKSSIKGYKKHRIPNLGKKKYAKLLVSYAQQGIQAEHTSLILSKPSFTSHRKELLSFLLYAQLLSFPLKSSSYLFLLRDTKSIG